MKRRLVGGVMGVAALCVAQADLDSSLPARDHARSVVATKYGIVATSQTLASAAGVKILEAEEALSTRRSLRMRFSDSLSPPGMAWAATCLRSCTRQSRESCTG